MSRIETLLQFTAVCALLTLQSCKDQEITSRKYPVVDTKAVSGIDTNGVTLNGEILYPGSTGISDHGFVYSESSTPNFDNAEKISLGPKASVGVFSAIANRNLQKDKINYVRAYAVSNTTSTIVYGQILEFVSQGGSALEISDFTPK